MNSNSHLSLFEKDEERIMKKLLTRASKETTSRPVGDQAIDTSYSSRDSDKARVSNEKELKRIWAEEVEVEGSRSFFDKEIVKVHWIGAYSKDKGEYSPLNTIVQYMEKYGNKKSKDEVSCFGYTKESGIDYVPSMGSGVVVGVIVKGYTTYASATDAATHMTSRADDETKRKHSASGLHKRPMMTFPITAMTNMIVDKESFGKRSKGYHEIIVDNWSAAGFIIGDTKYFDEEKENWQGSIDNTSKESGSESLATAARAYHAKRELETEKIKSLGIKIYDTRLKEFKIPNPFTFTDDMIESEWNRLVSGKWGKGGVALSATVEGAPPPEISPVIISDKTISMFMGSQLEGELTFENCKLNFFSVSSNGATIKFKNCTARDSITITAGDISLSVIDCPEFNLYITDSVKIKNAVFRGFDFETKRSLLALLARQYLKGGSKIKIENCELPKEDNEELIKMLNVSSIEDFVKRLMNPLPPAPKDEKPKLPPVPDGYKLPPVPPPLPPLPPLPPISSVPDLSKLPPLPPPYGPGKVAEHRIIRAIIKEYISTTK